MKPNNGQYFTIEEIKAMPAKGDTFEDRGAIDACATVIYCEDAPMILRVEALDFMCNVLLSMGEDPATEQDVIDFVAADEDVDDLEFK